MISFARLAGVAVLLLSFGFLVTALPTIKADDIHLAITGRDAVSCVLAKLIVEVKAKILALLACGTVAELEVAVKVLVALLKTCADDLLKVGAGVTVTVEAQASIVTCVAGIITLLVKVCAQVSLKFGIVVVASLLAQIDVVVRLLLVNLNICISGIVVLIAKAIASVTVGIMAQVHLKLCLSVLGLAA